MSNALLQITKQLKTNLLWPGEDLEKKISNVDKSQKIGFSKVATWFAPFFCDMMTCYVKRSFGIFMHFFFAPQLDKSIRKWHT